MKGFFAGMTWAVLTATVVCLIADGAVAKEPERPFRAQSQEMVVGSCAMGLGVQWQGVGNATHLGRFEDSVCTVTTGGSFPLFDFETQGVSTAANGDQVFFTVMGTTDVSNDPCVAHGALTVVGGTGRFVGASGTSQLVALLPWVADFTCGPQQQTTTVGTTRY